MNENTDIINACVFYKRRKIQAIQIPPYTFYKILERMVGKNKLSRVGKGVYRKNNVHENYELSSSEIIKYYTSRNNSSSLVCGIAAGMFLINRYSILLNSSHADFPIIIYSSLIHEQKKNVSKIEIYRLPHALNPKECFCLEFLLILDEFGDSLANLGTLTCTLKQKYNDRCMNSILNEFHFKKKIIAFAFEILNKLNIKNSLSVFLCSVTKYDYPDVNLLLNTKHN